MQLLQQPVKLSSITMAKGSLIQSCKCFLILIILHFVTCEEYYVQNDPCNENPCVTLSSLVSSIMSRRRSDNITLHFASGNHNLESDLIVQDINSFVIFAEPFSSSTRIICDRDTKFEFRNVSSIAITGINFIGCSGNQLKSVGQFYITNCTFYNHPEVDGTTLNIAESTAYLEKVAFLSLAENVKYRVDTSLQPQENCTLDSETIYRILVNNSITVVTQSLFHKSVIGVGAVIRSVESSNIAISNSTFMNNRASCCSNMTCAGAILRVSQGRMHIHDSRFDYNQGIIADISESVARFTYNLFSNHLRLYSQSIYNRLNESIIYALGSNLNVSHSTFDNSTLTTITAHYSNASIDHNTFTDNSGVFLMFLKYINVVHLHHNEFTNNTVYDLIGLFVEWITITLNEFVSNRVDFGLVEIMHNIQPENITNNIFVNNYATYDLYINSYCKPGLSTSLGSSRCIKCPERWYLNLLGLLITAFVAGILLIVFMLALNLTIDVGTLNGILFYANIMAANMQAYFPLSSTPNISTVFISWLNLDIGFDVCAFEGMAIDTKALLQLAFPAYVVLLIIIIIVTSEYSSRFAKLVGKGNPVAVLATMILITFIKLFKSIIGSESLLYYQPAYGSLNFNPQNFIVFSKKYTFSYTKIGMALIAISSLIAPLGFLFTALVFFWQWLIQYQDKVIFKWVRYQKLQHFMEPYHAPYTAKHRYWTGLLLTVRIALFCVSAINFSRDPRVDFVSTIFVIGFLILFKGVVAKRIYKNILLDVMETAIYFNMVFFAAFSWYSLDVGGNQTAVAHVSVTIIMALLLAVIVFHVLRFTNIYKLSRIRKSFKWIISKVTENKPVKEDVNEDELDEIDGVLLERAKPPYISYSVLQLSQDNETDFFNY